MQLHDCMIYIGGLECNQSVLASEGWVVVEPVLDRKYYNWPGKEFSQTNKIKLAFEVILFYRSQNMDIAEYQITFYSLFIWICLAVFGCNKMYNL